MINSFGTGKPTDAGGKADGEENGSGSSGSGGFGMPGSPEARKVRKPEARSPKARKSGSPEARMPGKPESSAALLPWREASGGGAHMASAAKPHRSRISAAAARALLPRMASGERSEAPAAAGASSSRAKF